MYYIIPHISTTFCESQWRYNSTGEYSSHPDLSEPDNALSSLTFTCFGIWGIISTQQSNQYYILMSLNILTGISSYLHHYYYTDTHWAYAADIINVQLLTSYILLYLLCDIELINTSIPLLRQLAALLIIVNCEIMIIFYNIGYGPRNKQLQIVMLLILLLQFKSSYLVLKNNLIITSTKHIFIYRQLWCLLLFIIACCMWNIDTQCYSWMHYTFNAHAIWHITIAWVAFNTINLSNQYLCIKESKIYTIVSPIPKQISYLIIILFKVNATNKRADIDEQATMIDLEQLMLLDETISRNKRHRRVQSHS